jgi:hypothetical protein
VGVLVDEQIVSYKKMFLKEHFENMVFKLFLLHSLFFEGLKPQRAPFSKGAL